jgi:competence CoiA-like predicted nuclease
MPFIAVNKTTGERIDITCVEGPRLTLKASEMVCPVCGHPMMLKAGDIKRHHFAHMPGKEDCPYAQYAAGETQEHRDAKELIRSQMHEWFAEYMNAVGDLEVYIPEVMHARNRIADVLFTFPSGWRVAHEVQLAQITTAELAERTEDYASQGIDVFWWFGRDALKQQANGIWSQKTYGFVLKIQTISDQSKDDRILYSDDDDH